MPDYAQEFSPEREPRTPADADDTVIGVSSATSARLRDLTQAHQSPTGSIRQVLFVRSQIADIRSQVEEYNLRRAKVGRSQLAVNLVAQHVKDPRDDLITWERLVLRLIGDADAVAGIELRGLTDDPKERRLSTSKVLAAAAAVVRLAGYRYEARQSGADSTPAQMEAYVRDVPGGPARTRLDPTSRDEDLAAQARAWAARQEPTTEYMKSLQRILSGDLMDYREVPTAVSCFAGYLRELNTTTPTRDRSRHLNRVGDKIRAETTVRLVQPIYHPQRTEPHWLHLLATDDGDIIKWISHVDTGLKPRDRIELFGRVAEHAYYRGEQQTVMESDCIVRPRVVA